MRATINLKLVLKLSTWSMAQIKNQKLKNEVASIKSELYTLWI